MLHIFYSLFTHEWKTIQVCDNRIWKSCLATILAIRASKLSHVQVAVHKWLDGYDADQVETASLIQKLKDKKLVQADVQVATVCTAVPLTDLSGGRLFLKV